MTARIDQLKESLRASGRYALLLSPGETHKCLTGLAFHLSFGSEIDVIGIFM